MLRRLNYTGRLKLPRSQVRIRLREDGGRRRFDADLNIGSVELPDDSRIFVEAYYRSAYRRFDFGTVRDRRDPADRFLDGIPSQSPLFRVKIVKSYAGVARILAAADKVVPEPSDAAADGRESLLPVEYEDLGDRVWALALDREADWPRLRLNRRFDGIREAARSGAEFLSLVYPEVFRMILEGSLGDGRADPDSNDDDWQTRWLRFACWELHQPRPPQGPLGTDAAEWIEACVNAFCVRLQVAPAFRTLLAQDRE